MTRRAFCACVVAGLLGTAAPGGAEATGESILAGAPRDLLPTLQRDRSVVVPELPDDVPEGWIVAYVLFARPLREVLGLMRQAERQPEYRTELTSVETVGQLPDGRIDEQRIEIVFQEFVYRLRYRDDPGTGRLEWRLDPEYDNDLRAMRGFWELAELEDGSGTVGRFGSYVDVGNVPAFLQRNLSRKTVIRYMQNCQRWIDSGGSWRP